MTSVLETMVIIINNGGRHYRHSTVTATCSRGMIELKLHLSRPLSIRAGQYVNVWIPSASRLAFLQSHPFVVTSWSDRPQKTLDFFVQPRHGFTRNLLRIANEGQQVKGRSVIVAGPYGQAVPVGQYEKVILVAEGAGIAAQLPYLQKLIQGYKARQAFTRRIHLIWQISDIGESCCKCCVPH